MRPSTLDTIQAIAALLARHDDSRFASEDGEFRLFIADGYLQCWVRGQQGGWCPVAGIPMNVKWVEV